jgi:hypothetical protein
VSSTSINVTWGIVPLIDQNGDITMYEVLYEPLETFNGSIGSSQEFVLAPNQAFLLINLQEDVTYTIRVRAVTNGGPGVISEGIMLRTFEDG